MRARKKSTLRESVYGSLRTLIMTGDLPPGSRLTENVLADRLKVSRTPLREALNRLERDGLVTNQPRRGYFVTLFDLKTLEDALDVREVLDGYAAGRAAALIGPADKRALRDLVERCEALATTVPRTTEDMIEEMQLGLEIHLVIARVSGNGLLCETLSRILDKYQHFIWLELLSLDEWGATRREHAAIVDAICAGDGDRAADLAARHVRGSRDNVLRLLRAQAAYRAARARTSSAA
jgi:DNA-binding GntR family transcriptional regulator